MSRKHSEAGVSLIEILVVIAVISVLAAASTPSILASVRINRVNTAAQTVAATIRGARYAAVSKNRTVRVLFNCPAADQMRMVEVTGNAGIDSDADRCSNTVYPYPDTNTAVAPNIDGPVITLENAQFGAVQSIQIDTQGRIVPLTGCPACVTAAAPASIAITNTYATRTITISANGQITGPS